MQQPYAPKTRQACIATVQMTIDEPLLAQVERMIQKLGMTRSAFVWDALQLALRQQRIAEMERQHAERYARCPAEPGDSDIWGAG